MKKIAIVLASVFLLAAGANAFEYDMSLNVQFVPQNIDFNFVFQSDWLIKSDGFFRIGPTLDLGWGLAHFTQNGSNLMIYGFMFALGAKTQFRIIENLYIDADFKATAIYARFPTILWGDIGVGVSWYPVGKFFCRAMTDVLFVPTEAKFKGSISCGLRF